MARVVYGPAGRYFPRCNTSMHSIHYGSPTFIRRRSWVRMNKNGYLFDTHFSMNTFAQMAFPRVILPYMKTLLIEWFPTWVINNDLTDSCMQHLWPEISACVSIFKRNVAKESQCLITVWAISWWPLVYIRHVRWACGWSVLDMHALNAFSCAVAKETPRGGQEVPKGVRHGEERDVVHGLSLEEGLSEIHRLKALPHF